MSWKLISKKEVFSHPFRTVEEWKFLLPSGYEHTFAISPGKDVVVVFGITDDDQVLLIHEYYMAHMKKVPALVAGMVDDGYHRETAIRELAEEAGCAARDVTYLGSSYKGKYATGDVHFYLAQGVTFVGSQSLEAAEDIDTTLISVNDFIALLRGGELQSIFEVACAYRALDHLGKL